MLEPYLQRPRRRSSIDKQTKVLLALHFYATGSYQVNIGSNIFVGLSQSSISRSINEVTAALNEPLVFNEWVYFPNIMELERTRQNFYEAYGFPGVIGCIDCTHVAIVPPNQEDEHYPEHIYVNRKNYHSINVQLICDEKMRIINVNSRFPGSVHDAHIWNQSNVRDAVMNLSRTHPGLFLIGDSGYPLRPWLITPFPDPPPNTPESEFNRDFCRTRSIIERCNGLLKGRFRCLLKDRVLHYSPTVSSKIIKACTVLRNMCIHANIPEPEPEEGDNDRDFGILNYNYEEPNEGVRINPDLRAARNLRRRIIENYFDAGQ